MKLTSDQVKAAVAAYWRFKRSCVLVALEPDYGSSDIYVVNRKRLLLDIEVKVSISDLRAEKKKYKHMFYQKKCPRDPVVNYFYFAVPKDMAIKAALICDSLFPYAGVIGTDCKAQNNGYLGHDIDFYRNARLVLDKETKATTRELVRLAKSQTATVCRLAGKVVKLKYG